MSTRLPFEQTYIDTLRSQPVSQQGHLIEGLRVPASNDALMEVVSPIDGQVFTHIANGTVNDMDQAIASARVAFDDGRWSKMSLAARKAVLFRLADLIDAESLALSVLGVRDNGTEISMAFKAESGSAAGTFRYYAEAVDKCYGQIAPTAESVLGLVHHEPVGVVGAIVPWNFPLMIGAWKLGPALASGNCVVLKPAETASLALLRLGELALEAGLPPGVLNIVTGEGKVVGRAMGLSPLVDVLVFTGSGATGRRLLQYAAQSNLKRVYLELGGKSPNIVFADAPDLDHAAKVSAAAIFRNSGQVCIAGSRLLVEASIHDDFVDALCRVAEMYNVGDPLELTTDIGAVNNEHQLALNLNSVRDAEAQGAHTQIGGTPLHVASGGYYMSPTVITGVKSHHALARNEIFGPVLAVTAFNSEQEAVTLANDSELGLAAGVWTSELSRAHRMVRNINAGVVHVNTYGGADNTVPLGGIGQSGNGHDKSMHALGKYTNLKTAWMQL
ncbi:MAG: aldehyde dehydrogenase family protein [Granulosicoccus sp.]